MTDPTPTPPSTLGQPVRPADWQERTATYQQHFTTAVDALLAAIRTEVTDGAETISHLLATTAANLGGIHTLTAGRPGSWEADFVDRFIGSTVGSDGDYLLAYRTAPIEVVECIDQAMVDLDIWDLYDDSYLLIENAEAHATNSDDDATSEAAFARLEQAEQLLDELRERDHVAYRAAFEHQVQVAADELYRSRHLPESVAVLVRWVKWADRDQATAVRDAWGTVEHKLWETARAQTPPPGFTEPLAEIPATRSPGKILQASGRMPHQRIPELAHYTQPATGSADGGERP